MRVAIVHYWLLRMRGGERVVEALCRLLPEADLFTLFYEPGAISDEIRGHCVKASFLNPLRRIHRHLLPLMPLALERFDLRGYDLVISSESGPAKGVITSSSQQHVCYCHSPMRYLWELWPDYLCDWTRPSWRKAAMLPVGSYLRLWDVASALRVDKFVANCENTQRRIWKTYRRESTVVYPPVDVASYYSKPAEDYFLVVGELTGYKRIDSAVRAFAESGRRLRVIGDGPEYASLRKLARPNIEFCGRVSESELREAYARCRALVLPGEEDFGLTPVEAFASGKPVIAYAKGGVLESFSSVSSLAGVLYGEPSVEQLHDALRRFDRLERWIDSTKLKSAATRFSISRFLNAMGQILDVPVGDEVVPPARERLQGCSAVG
jgi:glycosyltransferase involved in cell wall biosynthesis